jgi:hypothetical protein
MFTLVLGKGVKQSGDAATFADIDWSVTPKFIRTEIDYGGWKTMGASRLWSVPYAMAAGDISGALSRLEVTGEPSADDEALFEVKNKNGQTVFAVYNEGVRVNVGSGENKAVKGGFAIGSFDETKLEPKDLMVVTRDSVRVYIYDDPLNKAVKGGFAIGGFDETKGFTYDYMLVSPDSIRMYIDQSSGKAVKGGFAIGGFDETKAPLNEYLRVSPDSVRVYIDKSTGKAVKGGFAIGSFDETKAPGQEYLRVTDDSVRVYIDDQSKAVKGGFAIGGFDETKAGGNSFFDVNTSSAGTVNPSENRILWYPVKNAFLTGKVLIEKPDSVGENSFASGFESKAKGNYSQALGYQAISRGTYSTAIGQNAVAHSSNSYAFGKSAVATGVESFAFGSGAKASGLRSFSFGSIGLDSLGIAVTDKPTTAEGSYAIAVGLGATASDKGSMSFGVSSLATEEYALAMGYGSRAAGPRSISLGNSAFYSESVIYPAPFNYLHRNPNAASGSFGIAIGAGNSAASGGLAMGLSNQASAWGAVAIGFSTKATAERSVAMGYRAGATGKYGVAIGNYTTAQAFNSVVVGSLNLEVGSTTTWVDTDPLFVVGNGNILAPSPVRSNAFMVTKNGNSTTYGNHYVYKGVSAKTGTIHDSLTIGLYRSMQSNKPYLELKETNALPPSPFSYSYSMTVSGKQFKIQGATNTRFSILENGNVGIGSMVPAYKLDVDGEITSRATNSFRLRSTSFGVLLRNDNDGFHLLFTSSGNPDGTWNNALRPFSADLASGDVAIAKSLLVKHAGNVGIGTVSPVRALHVVSSTTTGGYAAQFENPGSGRGIYVGSVSDVAVRVESTYQTGYSGHFRNTNGGGGITGESSVAASPGTGVRGVSTYRAIYGQGPSGGTTGWSNWSDARLKDDVQTISDALDRVLQLRGVTFIWKTDPEYHKPGRSMGFLAQEVESIIPEVVSYDEREDRYEIMYAPLTALLAEAIKQQHDIIELQSAKIDQQQSELESLKGLAGEVQSLKSEIEALKSMMINGSK